MNVNLRELFVCRKCGKPATSVTYMSSTPLLFCDEHLKMPKLEGGQE
jgi:hypothetical protein